MRDSLKVLDASGFGSYISIIQKLKNAVRLPAEIDLLKFLFREIQSLSCSPSISREGSLVADVDDFRGSTVSIFNVELASIKLKSFSVVKRVVKVLHDVREGTK